MRCARRTCVERVQSHDLALVLRGHDAWCKSGIHTSRGMDWIGQHALHTRSARAVLWTARGFRLPLLMMTATKQKQQDTLNYFRSLVRMHKALSSPVLREVFADSDREMLVRVAAGVILESREGRIREEAFSSLGLR